MPPLLVISCKQGQLGNRLHHFAHLLAFAKQYGFSLINLSFDDYAPFFESTSSDLFCHYSPDPDFLNSRNIATLLGGLREQLSGVVTRFPRLPQDLIKKIEFASPVELICDTSPVLRKLFYVLSYELASSIVEKKNTVPGISVLDLKNSPDTFQLGDPQFLSWLNKEQVVLFEGWLFRDSVSFNAQADFVRQYFRPLTAHCARVGEVVGRLRSRGDKLIGVHIRQGDYAQFMEGRYFYSVDQYKNLMRKAVSLFKDSRIAFLITSDIAHDPQAFSEFNFSFGPGQMVEDMYALSACDLIMGPPSTFSSWASFINKVPCYSIEDPDVELSLRSFGIG